MTRACSWIAYSAGTLSVTADTRRYAASLLTTLGMALLQVQLSSFLLSCGCPRTPKMLGVTLLPLTAPKILW